MRFRYFQPPLNKLSVQKSSASSTMQRPFSAASLRRCRPVSEYVAPQPRSDRCSNRHFSWSLFPSEFPTGRTRQVDASTNQFIVGGADRPTGKLVQRKYMPMPTTKQWRNKTTTLSRGQRIFSAVEAERRLPQPLPARHRPWGKRRRHNFSVLLET